VQKYKASTQPYNLNETIRLGMDKTRVWFFNSTILSIDASKSIDIVSLSEFDKNMILRVCCGSELKI